MPPVDTLTRRADPVNTSTARSGTPPALGHIADSRGVERRAYDPAALGRMVKGPDV